MSYLKNSRVKWLLSRSYGQGGTVALPTSGGGQSLDIIGDFPAGVYDVLNRMEECYTSWPTQDSTHTPLEWCFLVGGPGNGKSEALRFLADTLGIQLPTRTLGQPAPRTVPQDWPKIAEAVPNAPNLEMVFINDASIPRTDALDESSPGSLFLDIADGLNRLFNWEKPTILFGNVNRGILVEEEARLSRVHPNHANTSDLAASIIRWLLDTPEEVGLDYSQGKLQTTVPLDHRKPYYAQFYVPVVSGGGSRDLVTHVVFLDALSLLEPAPGQNGDAIRFNGTGLKPTVSDYSPFGRLCDNGATRENTVAGSLLLDRLVDDIEWEGGGCIDPATNLQCEAVARCPFVQNAKWLRQLSLARNFLDIMRAAEITASRRITYRDLLGHLSLALIGHSEETWLKDQHPCQWVEDRVRAIEDANSPMRKAAVAELIGHRIYSTLFPLVDLESWKRLAVPSLSGDSVYKVVEQSLNIASESSRARAYNSAYRTLDPARDVEHWDGIRQQALEAIESLDIVYPSQSIQQKGLVAVEAISELEHLLDQVLQGEIEGELSRNPGQASRAALSRVKLLRKWRSTLLLRQVGLATGNFSFKLAVSLWLAEQENALSESDPRELGRGVRALILPRQERGELLLAPLRPRTYSLSRNELPTETLMVSVTLRDLWVDIVPQGDILTAVVTRGREQRPIASLVIDLAIAREAVLNSESESGSFTEIGPSAFARIERVRASLVSRDRLGKATTYYTDKLGVLYRVRRNPTGQASLTIEREG